MTTILCINLDSRPDRWAQATEEFKRVGLTVERFPAITGDNRPLAFNQSVYACMKIAKQRGGDLFLLEDDVVFDGQLPSFAIPDGDWMTLHMGANIIGSDIMSWQMPEKVEAWTGSPHGVVRLHNCWQSHATMYSARCIDYIIENFPYYTDEYKTEGLIIFDEWLRLNVLNQGHSYLFNPMVAYQRPSVSNIWGDTHMDYTGAHTAGNEWLKRNL
jgi:hypothetical protein